MADESYWTYKTSYRTPTLSEAIEVGAISAKTTDKEWHQLSPGMRREIVRQATRKVGVA